MPPVFWTGKLTPSMMLLMDANCLLAWAMGHTSNITTMTNNVRSGYEGSVTDDITAYDQLTESFQKKGGKFLLDQVDVRGREVLDVGGGTGIASRLVLERGAARVVCGDIAELMLNLGREKSERLGYPPDRLEFRQMDASSLPYPDACFDLTISSLAFGLLPHQPKAVAEMARVTRSGGIVAIGAHGPEHYWEACDAFLHALSKWHLLGQRLEYWPRNENEMIRFLKRAGLIEIGASRTIWRNKFATGLQAYDFFTAVTSAWWLSRYPKDRVGVEVQRVRNYFEHKPVNQITDDIIVVTGRRP